MSYLNNSLAHCISDMNVANDKLSILSKNSQHSDALQYSSPAKIIELVTDTRNAVELSDSEVIQRYLKTGNNYYFSIIYDRYSKKTLIKCYSILNDLEKAEDATQDIFIKLLLKINDFAGKAKFSTWLYSVTYNHCIDLIRKSKKNPAILIDSNSEEKYIVDNIDDSLILETNISRLEVILEVMPQPQKSVLLMKYQDEMSIKDMGLVLQKSESAVKMQIKRAKEKFIKIHNSKFSDSL